LTTRLPNLRGLEAFVTVGEAGSIRTAATRLNLTASAVSRRIAALERDLDASLVVRTPQGISLTREGRALHRVVSRSFAAIARQIAGQRAAPRHVVIKAPHSFASRWLADHLRRLHERFPMASFAVETSPRIERLAAGEIAIRFGFGDWTDGIATRLVSVPMQAVAGPAWRGHDRLTRRELETSRILVVNGTERVWSRWLGANRLGTLAGLERLSFDNTDVAIRAAAAGTGITIVGTRFSGSDSHRLVRFDQTTTDVGAGYYLVVPRGARSTLPARELARWLRAQFR
jgi:LysR family transcriptional regulator, glycine cleavage system transcriptional activator